MKKRLMTLIVGGALALASSAWSYSISLNGGTSVGDKDELRGSVDITTWLSSNNKKGNSGDSTELDWINSVLHTEYTSYTPEKYQVSADMWKKVNDPEPGLNLYALNLAGTPDYFLIKTGNTQNEYKWDTYLFENKSAFDWAVIDLADVQILEISSFTVDKISHVGEVGSAPVPEPGTMMLLGAGFLGLAVYGKRRKNV